MKKAFFAICLLGTLLLLAGCGRGAPEEQYLSHWEKIVSLISQNKNDAAGAQAAVKSYLDAHLEEMKSLAGRFGQEAGGQVAENPDFIRRVLNLVDTLNGLAATNKSLLDDQQVAQAYAPLADLTK